MTRNAATNECALGRLQILRVILPRPDVVVGDLQSTLSSIQATKLPANAPVEISVQRWPCCAWQFDSIVSRTRGTAYLRPFDPPLIPNHTRWALVPGALTKLDPFPRPMQVGELWQRRMSSRSRVSLERILTHESKMFCGESKISQMKRQADCTSCLPLISFRRQAEVTLPAI